MANLAAISKWQFVIHNCNSQLGLWQSWQKWCESMPPRLPKKTHIKNKSRIAKQAKKIQRNTKIIIEQKGYTSQFESGLKMRRNYKPYLWA